MAKSVKKVYADGIYIGDSVDALYGKIQVKLIIKKGKLKDIGVLDYPKEAVYSEEINDKALPILKREAIVSQGSDIKIVSGATETSNGFFKSLGSALLKARYKKL